MNLAVVNEAVTEMNGVEQSRGMCRHSSELPAKGLQR